LAKLEHALRDRPWPFVIANPDLVAPRDAGLSKTSGFYVHEVAQRLEIAPGVFVEPYGNPAKDALARLARVDRTGNAMVGDTLHTGILGWRAARLRTVQERDLGVFAGPAVDDFVTAGGPVPDYSCPSI